MGGEKKKRIYGLGFEAKSYYGQNLCISSSVPPLVSQLTPTTNMDELVKQMIPVLAKHFLPVILKWVQEVLTSTSNLSVETPIVPPTTTNVDKVDPLVSTEDRIP